MPHDDPEGAEAVFVVGSDGIAIRSPDGGAHWEALEGDGPDFTAVALDGDASVAVLTGADGSIWRWAEGEPLRPVLAPGGGALHAVAASHAGRTFVAVGDDGAVLTSANAGLRFTPVDALTTRDLFAVQVGGHRSEEVIAVGEAGVVVRIDEAGATAQELLDPALALHGLHLRSSGSGQVVGDAGVVLLTEDLGRSWQALDVDTDVALRGVDDFHVGAHF